MWDELQIRPLEPGDLPAVAAVHMMAFRGNPLTWLGSEGVRRYYAWQLQGPHDVTALGAFRGAECVGFCFGGVFRGALSGYLKKNRVFLIVRVLTHPWLLASAVMRDRAREMVRLLSRGVHHKRPSGGVPGSGRSFGILAIAVAPKCQGSGAGRRLMHESEEVARRRGFREMDLTVRPDNLQAIRFYEQLGWSRAAENDVWRGRMRKAL